MLVISHFHFDPGYFFDTFANTLLTSSAKYGVGLLGRADRVGH